MTFRIIRDGIDSLMCRTNEDPRTDEQVFETFRVARQNLLRYLRDRRDSYNHVIHRIEHTAEKDLHP